MEEFLSEILEIIRSNKSNKEKKEQLNQYHDSDIADVFNELDDEEKLKLARLLGKDRLSDVLSYLDNSDEFFELLKDEDVADVIELMDADDAVDVLENLEEEDRDKIIELMEQEAQEDVKLILSYSKEQAGSLMTTNFVKIHNTDNVKKSMNELVAQAKENDNISSLIVLDNDDKFYGMLDLKDLICARAEDDLSLKIKTNYPYVYADSLIDDIIQDLKEYAEDIIPVLDSEDKVLGVITSDDIVELVQKEAEEDYNRLAGLTKQESAEESIWGSIKKRIPWLALLLVLGLVVSSVVSAFSNVISGVTAAIFFQSVVFDMAGNGGTQSLAVTLTKITNNEDFSGKKMSKMLLREFLIGLLNGVILGTLAFGVVLSFLVIRHDPITNNGVYNFMDCLKVGGCVAISLIISISISSVLGLVLPVLFKKIKLDPAVASGPMITTINDITSACIYYTLVGVLFAVLF